MPNYELEAIHDYILVIAEAEELSAEQKLAMIVKVAKKHQKQEDN